MNQSEALEYLRRIVDVFLPPNLTRVCRLVIDDPEFQNGYGSSDKHHAYKGALPVHTAEVLKNAFGMVSARSFGIEPRLDILIPAVIYHDCAKIRDYDAIGNPTWYKKHIYHIAGSYAYWKAVANENEIELDLQDQVGHCILAHHGRRDWKAVVEPQTVEAWILHFADTLSAGYGAGK